MYCTITPCKEKDTKRDDHSDGLHHMMGMESMWVMIHIMSDIEISR